MLKAHRKRAQIPLKVLIGMLLGIMLLISSCSIVKTVLKTRSPDYERSFKDFTTTLQQMAAEPAGTIDTPGTQLREDSAIIILGPKQERDAYDVLGVERFTKGEYTPLETIKASYEERLKTTTGEEQEEVKRAYEQVGTEEARAAYEQRYHTMLIRNGRFGDGDLHITSHDQHSFGGSAVAIQGGAMYKEGFKAAHFARPQACPAEQACACLCQDPVRKAVEEDYVKSLQVDEDLRTPYDRTSFDDLKEHYLYKTRAHAAVNCEGLTCRPIGEIEVYTPLPVTVNEQEQRDYPSSMYENGIVFDRSGQFTATPLEDTAREAGIVIGKLSNGQLAACLDYTCFEELEKRISQDTPLTEKEVLERLKELPPPQPPTMPADESGKYSPREPLEPAGAPTTGTTT